MRFYRSEVLVTGSEWSKNMKNGRMMREQLRRIAAKGEPFNQKIKHSAFFFVADADEEAVILGIFWKGMEQPDKQLEAYVHAIGVDSGGIHLEEITFDDARNMLDWAERKDFAAGSNGILDRFDVHELSTYRRELKYEERLFEERKKEDIYSRAGKLLLKESVTSELDRIYVDRGKRNALGHPVQYMIQTDDRAGCDETCRLLLCALYANGRLHSKRYCTLDIRSYTKINYMMLDLLYKNCEDSTVVIRLSADTDTENQYANPAEETIKNLCEAIKKYHNQVLTIFCMPQECTKVRDLLYENLAGICFVELKEELVSDKKAEDFLRGLAKGSGFRADKKLFSLLEPQKGYFTLQLKNLFQTWYDERLRDSVYPQYKGFASPRREMISMSPSGTAYEELMEMTGLDEPKKVIIRAINYYKAQKLFADKGAQTETVAMHMIFTGSPGTAKTSVARLFARIMRENRILSKGHLVEVGRSDLVGKYLGWTADLVKKKFQEAMGGVLFVDEAYSLVDDRDGSYGDEAINTIVQEMENHREEVVVIFAGYPDKMKFFLQKNPGLRSRIAFHVTFPDYNTDELCEIARQTASKKGLSLTDEACEKLQDIFETARRESNFGNGRYVRNILEKARMAQAARLLAMEFDMISDRDIRTICAEDIETSEKEPCIRKQIGFLAS